MYVCMYVCICTITMVEIGTSVSVFSVFAVLRRLYMRKVYERGYDGLLVSVIFFFSFLFFSFIFFHSG